MLEKASIGGRSADRVEEAVRREVDLAVGAVVEIQPIGRGATSALNGSWGSTERSRRWGS